MHILKIGLILATAAAPLTGFAQVLDNAMAKVSEVNVQRSGDNEYQLTLKSYRSSNVTAGQEELMPKAAQLCAPRSASFGRYSFNMTEQIAGAKDKPGMLVLRQDIECGAAASAAPPAAAQAGTAPGAATEEQVRRVEEQSRLYFDARDQGEYTLAYEVLAASAKHATSFEAWKGIKQAFNAKAGAAQQRTISKITWYRNPPQVEPGLYAAVDFTSKFAEIDIHCGFLAWREQSDGQFVLVREEENYIDKQTQQRLKPDDIEKVRQQFRCK
ncbi:DUF4019 domain-containing protein [Duganella sp. FT27W]|uniref:DUF4019 domain-containing protein n=1 Tax=Duganella sp. FT27W TaxID=2654636 RepID=UPI00128C948D|nr:DUF4019 domain-containing protein [Duganella sp. FT27W]MPQ55260.1 DUF4019 domain-containing protein [Duganella sp. FT27W]